MEKNQFLHKSLFHRELNVGKYFNSLNYKKNIIKSFYENSNFLSKTTFRKATDVDAVFIYDLKVTKNGNFIATGAFKNLGLLELNNMKNPPVIHKFEGEYNVFNLAENSDSSKIFSANKNLLIDNDTATLKIVNTQRFNSIENLSSHPANPNLISVATQQSLNNYDSRTTSFQETSFEFKLKTIQHHPVDDHLLLMATSCKKNAYLFDKRNQSIVFEYHLLYGNENGPYCAKYNQKGNQILITGQCINPLVFDCKDNYPCFEFEELGYYKINHQSSNNCCFAGLDDEYIVADSCNYNIFIWEIPKKKNEINEENNRFIKKVSTAKHILKGHTTYIDGINFSAEKSILVSHSLIPRIIIWSFLLNSTTHKDNETHMSTDTSCDNKKISLMEYYFSCIFYDKSFSERFKNKFNFVEQSYFSLEEKTLELKIKKDFNIDYIKSFIINYKIDGQTKYESLFQKINATLERNEFVLTMIHYGLIVEIRKLFTDKSFIKNSLKYLKLQVNTTKNAISKLFFAKNNQFCTDLHKKIELLKKFQLIFKILFYDLLVIEKDNKNLYEKSFLVVEKTMNVYNGNTIDSLKTELLDDFFDEDKNMEKTKNDFVNSDFKFRIKFKKGNLNLIEYLTDKILDNLKNDMKFEKFIEEKVKNINLKEKIII